MTNTGRPGRIRPGSLALSAGGPAAAAIVGGIAARRAPEVYRVLEKPRWAPPAGIFGPVWSALYTAMGAAAWRISARPGARPVLVLHASQLVFNAGWPIAFFARRSKRESMAVIAALDVLVAAELALAWRRDRVSGALLAPYLGWCLFATALNGAVRWPVTAPLPSA